MLYDAHNHLQGEPLTPHLPAMERELMRIGLAKAVVNGTCEEDWDRVSTLAGLYPWVIPAYGLHPWYLEGRSPQWRKCLAQRLETSRAVVGEIGLDRAREETPFEVQKEIFSYQLELAAKLGLPVTIHCVKAWGALWEIVRTQPVPECGFLLHGYHGPAEMVEGFAKRGAYFSYCGMFLNEAKTARREVFRTIPAERLLVETDAPFMPLPPEYVIYPYPGLNHPANIQAVYDGLAKLRGCHVEILAAQVAKNFQRLFGDR